MGGGTPDLSGSRANEEAPRGRGCAEPLSISRLLQRRLVHAAPNGLVEQQGRVINHGSLPPHASPEVRQDDGSTIAACAGACRGWSHVWSVFLEDTVGVAREPWFNKTPAAWTLPLLAPVSLIT